MTEQGPQHISSSANPLVKDLRRLAHDPGGYRKQGRAWLEGDHLCRAALGHGRRPAIAVFTESMWFEQGHAWALEGVRTMLLPEPMFASLSSLESPGRMGFVIDVPESPALDPLSPSVILDRLQDAGNVGSILRTAAAMGFRQVLAMKGTAALWSPKVLRAGMGAHFALNLVESLDSASLDALRVPLLATSSHEGLFLHEATLPWPCAWLLGHEGQGVAPELAERAAQPVRIAQPGGEESLNVAAAAAICLHASATGVMGAKL